MANTTAPNPATPLFTACKQAFIDAMSYAPPVNLTPALQQQMAASAASRMSTLDTQSTIFANDMVTAFEEALASQSSNLPGITFALKDSTGADVTGTITLTPYVAPTH